MNKSLDYRRDNRTVKEFKKDIKQRTAKEAFLMELFRKEVLYRGKSIVVKNHGVDNEGELQDKSNVKADYCVIIDDIPYLLEVKNSWVEHKITFKTYQLTQYVKQKAQILLFYNTGKLDKDPTKLDVVKTRWAIIDTVQIEKMLKLTHYSEPLFGGKPCVKIYSNDYDKYFTSHKLEHLESGESDKVKIPVVQAIDTKTGKIIDEWTDEPEVNCSFDALHCGFCPQCKEMQSENNGYFIRRLKINNEDY